MGLFLILISTLSSKLRRLPKQTVLAHGTAPPPFIASLDAIENASGIASGNTGCTVAAVHYEPKVIREYQIDRYGKVHPLDSQHAKADWSNISEDYSGYRLKFVKMLELFSTIWDAHLRKMSVGGYPIDLTAGAAPVHSAPYRAGLKVHAFQSVEIAMILELTAIQPATARWAAPIVFAPKMNSTLRFCVDYRTLNTVTQLDLSTTEHRLP